MGTSADASGNEASFVGTDAALGGWLGPHGLAVVAVDDSHHVVWANETARALIAESRASGQVTEVVEVTEEMLDRAIVFGPGLLDGLGVGDVLTGRVTVSASHALLDLEATALGARGASGAVAVVSFAVPQQETNSEQVRRLETMLRRTNDIITVIDRNGTVLYSNEAAGRITGIQGTEANGSSMLEFIHPEDHRIAEDAFTRGVIAGEPVEPIEVRMRYADGAWHHVEASIDALGGEDPEDGYVVTIHDVTDRVRRQHEQAVSERRLESIVENIDDVIVILDETMSVLWASPGIERLVDAPAYTNVGENAFNDMHPDDVEGAVAVIQAVMADPDGRGRCDLRLQHRRMGWRWVEVALVNRMDDPAVGGVVCTLRDVTDQRTTDVELRRLSDEARDSAAHVREADRLKDEFLGTVSHELRTPLTAVRGFSELLAHRSDRLDQATREQLASRIHDNACAMNDMIEQLLDFSRLKAGRVEIDIEALDLDELVAATLDHLRPQLDAHELDADVDGCRVLADRRGFHHALRNLLTNAARYSAAGSVIELRADRRDGQVRISVRDHGIGIDEEDHARIFQSFYQSDPGATGRRGTGVGLNIARRYAQLQSGHLWMESVPGEGSTFTLVLPEAP